MGGFKATGSPFRSSIQADLKRKGKVLHHSTAWNSKRNEYLVVFDFDVNNDDVPDKLYAFRTDTSLIMVGKILDISTNIEGHAGTMKLRPTVSVFVLPVSDSFCYSWSHLRTVQTNN